MNKWAEHPFNRFMEVKEVTVDRDYSSMNLHQTPEGQTLLFVGTKKGFVSYELDGETSECTSVVIDDSSVSDKGFIVGSVSVEKGVLICYTEYAFPVTVTGQPNGAPLKWRNPINTVSKYHTPLYLPCLFPLLNSHSHSVYERVLFCDSGSGQLR